MECYRKLCNRLYWKKLQPGTVPYTTRFWLIILSVISVLWLAFFFDPMDPTYSKSPSRLVTLLSKTFTKVKLSVYRFVCSVDKASANILAQIENFVSAAENIFLPETRHAYLKTSSLII